MAWKSTNQLLWEDFQGVPDSTLPFLALTMQDVSLSTDTITDDLFMLRVAAEFLPEESWVRSGAKTMDLLAHENLHFTIAELHARLLRQALTRHPPVSSAEVNKVISSEYDSIMTQRDAMQIDYDRETEHGIKRNEQLAWQKRIALELNKLRAYADQRVTMKLR